MLLVVGYHSWPTGCTAASSASTSPSSSRLPDPSHLHREGQTRDSAPQDAASTVQHFWSLPVEEQFYLVWPELILLLPCLR